MAPLPRPCAGQRAGEAGRKHLWLPLLGAPGFKGACKPCGNGAPKSNSSWGGGQVEFCRAMLPSAGVWGTCTLLGVSVFFLSPGSAYSGVSWGPQTRDAGKNKGWIIKRPEFFSNFHLFTKRRQSLGLVSPTVRQWWLLSCLGSERDPPR